MNVYYRNTTSLELQQSWWSFVTNAGWNCPSSSPPDHLPSASRADHLSQPAPPAMASPSAAAPPSPSPPTRRKKNMFSSNPPTAPSRAAPSTPRSAPSAPSASSAAPSAAGVWPRRTSTAAPCTCSRTRPRTRRSGCRTGTWRASWRRVSGCRGPGRCRGVGQVVAAQLTCSCAYRSDTTVHVHILRFAWNNPYGEQVAGRQDLRSCRMVFTLVDPELAVFSLLSGRQFVRTLARHRIEGPGCRWTLLRGLRTSSLGGGDRYSPSLDLRNDMTDGRTSG